MRALLPLTLALIAALQEIGEGLIHDDDDVHKVGLYVQQTTDLHKLPEEKVDATTRQPQECLHATNLTEPWRMDHNGSNIRPFGPHTSSGYACDLYSHLRWFRFTGKAGNVKIISISCGPSSSVYVWHNMSLILYNITYF